MLLNEIYVELGPNGPVAVRGKGVSVKGGYGYGNVKSETLSPSVKSALKEVIEYLKRKGLLKNITSKEDYETLDIQFNTDSAVVNFDNGGSTKVPLSASVVTENYFPY